MLNNFDRDNFLVRGEAEEDCLLVLPASVTSICIPGVDEFDSKIVLFNLSEVDSNGGDAIRRLFVFPESESDALPSDSS